MLRNLKWRLIIYAAVTLFAVLLFLPTLIPELPAWFYKIIPTDKIHLGLDLQGGMHLILEVSPARWAASSGVRPAMSLCANCGRVEWMTAVAVGISKGWSKEECIKRISFLDRLPVDIGQEYMGPRVQEMNVSALYDYLTGK